MGSSSRSRLSLRSISFVAPRAPARRRGSQWRYRQTSRVKRNRPSARPAHLALLHRGEAVPDLVQHGVGGVEVLLVLVVIPDVNIDAVLHAAPVGRELMGQNFEQRALAHAVGADQGHTIARAQLEAHVFKDGLAVIGLAQPLDLQRLLAAAAARIKLKRTCPSSTGFSSRSSLSRRFWRLSAALMLFSRLKLR